MSDPALDIVVAGRVVKSYRYQVWSLQNHQTPAAIQELERAGFQWLGAVALYHPVHWAPTDGMKEGVDLIFFGTSNRTYGLTALSVEAKMAANNGRALP